MGCASSVASGIAITPEQQASNDVSATPSVELAAVPSASSPPPPRPASNVPIYGDDVETNGVSEGDTTKGQRYDGIDQIVSRREATILKRRAVLAPPAPAAHRQFDALGLRLDVRQAVQVERPSIERSNSLMRQITAISPPNRSPGGVSSGGVSQNSTPAGSGATSPAIPRMGSPLLPA